MSTEVITRLRCDSRNGCLRTFPVRGSEHVKEARQRAAIAGWASGVLERHPVDYCPVHKLETSR